MRSQLPDIQQASSKEGKKSFITPPKINFKGITLKEYFRICDETDHKQPLQLI
jgi:hypothetical protein